MRTAVRFLFCFCLALASPCHSRPADLLQQAELLETAGDFRGASNLLAGALRGHDLAAPQAQDLRFELDRLERIRRDFPHTREALFTLLEKNVRHLSRKEFERWIKEDRFDRRTIDGEERFMVSSVSNLFFRYPALAARRTPPKDTRELEAATLETVRAIRTAAKGAATPYVLPKTFDVTMQLKVGQDVVPPGETIRAWLPIPRDYPHQRDYRRQSTSGTVLAEAGPDSPIRSLLIEQPAAARGEPTGIRLRYTYRTWAVHFAPQADRVLPADLTRPDLAPFVREGPHVIFTPELKALSQRLAGGESNPLLKARRFYEWIARHIRYSYAVEYSTVRNLSDHCLSRGYGDCGQEALLFITLCRWNGIPARWQSGWSTFPGAKTIHDWSEIYLEPYGWMPVDPYLGIFAMQYCPTLKAAERREILDFYFGGLDQYRMAANSDHSRDLTPPKRALRSDTVDFQRGELESNGQNIYFDRFDYQLSVSEIPDRSGKD